MVVVLFYDGVCGLCNRLLRFVLRRDRKGAVKFAALQSDWAAAELAKHGADAGRLDTVYLLTDDGRLLARSRAIFTVFRALGGGWGVLGAIGGVVPSFLTDLGYRVIARLRYRLFGKYEACQVPSADERARFIAASLDTPASLPGG